MINFSMELNDGSQDQKPIVRISYRIISAKRFKAMTDGQKKSFIKMIERFEASLKETKKQILKT